MDGDGSHTRRRMFQCILALLVFAFGTDVFLSSRLSALPLRLEAAGSHRAEVGSSKFAYVTMWLKKGGLREDVWLRHRMNASQHDLRAQAYKLPRIIPWPMRQFLARHSPWRRLGDFKHPFSLYEDLARVGTKFPLVVMTDDSHLLEANATLNPLLQFVPVPFGLVNKVNNNHCFTEDELSFTKFRMFALTEYEKAVWVDLDIVVTENIDFAFDLDVADGKVIHAQRNDCGYDSDGPFRKFLGIQLPIPTVGVNAGFIVFQPSLETHDGLFKQMASMPMDLCKGDQDVSEYYFSQEGRGVQFLPLEFVGFGWCCEKTEGRACPRIRHMTR
uniref:Nucleotide-diphospho-sugar transferase domain-containing protein n=1 Tax=Zooxanthella nutricula TaxID=1333877 RepID=A0A7S2NPI7_9DINO